MDAKTFKELNTPGTEVAYHGRDIEIIEYDGDYAICYDTAIGDSIAVSIEELIDQNYTLY